MGPRRVADSFEPTPLLTEASVTDVAPDLVVVPYEPTRHEASLREWAAHRSNLHVQFDLLPPTGFVVEGLAMMFMYRTDGPVVLIEGLVTNPESDPVRRGAAIERAAGALFDCARREGFRVVLAMTPRGAIVDRAKKLGFAAGDGNQTFISREVNAPFHRRP